MVVGAELDLLEIHKAAVRGAARTPVQGQTPEPLKRPSRRLDEITEAMVRDYPTVAALKGEKVSSQMDKYKNDEGRRAGKGTILDARKKAEPRIEARSRGQS
jgi:hypothetical protein